MAFLLAAMDSLIEHIRERTGDPYLRRLQCDYRRQIEQWFAEMLESPGARMLVVEWNGEPAGFVLGTLSAAYIATSTVETIGYIDLCWVAPQFRRQGLGTCLVAEVERWFAQHGIDFVEVNYLLGNREAELAWERLGYRSYRVSGRKRL